MPVDADDTRPLAALLAVEQVGADEYRGHCHAGAPLQVFGGQVAAQALVAAGLTTDRAAHSCHGTFLRRGDSRRPVTYEVERVRDGRTYSARSVSARQDSTTIFTLTASFKAPEPGHDRQSAMPDAPAPEELPDPYVWFASANPDLFGVSEWRRAVALRFVPLDDAGGRNDQLVWMRAVSPLAPDPLMHAAALTYCSDLTLGSTAAIDVEPPTVLREGARRIQLASLNHAVWFHRPFRADEWLLFAQRSMSASDGRGLSMGEFWSRDGQLVASAVQEVVVRVAAE